MLLMLLLLPTRMVAGTDYDTSVTFSALAGNPEGVSEAENFKKLFDGKEGNSSKWCCYFYGSAYVIFKASKAGVPVGYTITTGNDNEIWGGRNPKSWKLYGNNTGSDDAWELIDEVSDDKVLKDKNYASYEFTCKCSTSYQYFKWEISAVHGGDILQVGEFELKLQTCSHKNTDGSDALGEVINTVEPTCTEHGYTTHKCSLCNSIVKVYKDDVLKPHKLTHNEAKAATCTEAGNIEYWQCSVCNKLFSDEAATKEITDATSLVISANGHTFDREGNCTVCHYKDSRYALFNLEGITDVTITDNDSYPWKMLDLNADGMSNVSSYFTAESKGLMSSNYGVNDSRSEISVKFNVEKPILFSFKYLISAMNSNYVFITLNGKRLGGIYGTDQKVYKSILNNGEYTLTLSYNTRPFDEGNKGADRAFIYDLNTATTISDYVAELDATNTTLTFKEITSDNLGSIDLSRLVIVNDEPMVKDMYDIETTNIRNIVFDESFKTYAPTALYSFFKDLTELETIKDLKYLNTANVKYMSDMFWDCKKLSSLDLSKFNTEKVTDMSGMFHGCQKLSSLDLSKFNTEKVKGMSSMFEDCKNLSSLDLSKFNTEKVKDMRGMFYGCQKLSSLDLSNFNTANVMEMGNMFYNCSTLTSLDLSNFNTEKVESMSSMFENCKNLSSLDLSKFNTEKVENMMGMFYGCQKLTSLDLSNFNTANVMEMGNMFYNCSTLTSLDLSNFNTEKVESMMGMFFSCSALTSLDLSNFNTKKVMGMGNMFNACSALTTIYAGDKFVTEQVGDGSNMFSYCTNLKGFIDYTSNPDKIDHTYANYKTGYFTKLVVRNGDERYGITGETTQLTVDNLALADDKDFVAYEPFAAKAASYSRTMNAGTTWATLCLPFEVSLANQNFRAFKLLSADDVAETVELEEIETNIEAGTPVIIKMKDGATKLDFTVANKEIANEVKTAETANGNYQLQGLYTQKMFSKDTDNNCYIVKGVKLMNPAKLLDKTTTDFVGSKPFRAYMVDNSSAPASGARMFSISVGGSTTAIKQLETTADSKAEYYDLQGRRLQDLQKGINIVKRGGKTMKVIIK